MHSQNPWPAHKGLMVKPCSLYPGLPFGAGFSHSCIARTSVSHRRGQGKWECVLQTSSCHSCCVLTRVPAAIRHTSAVRSRFQEEMWLKGNWLFTLTSHFLIPLIWGRNLSEHNRERTAGLDILAQDIMKIRLEILISSYSGQGKGGGSPLILPPTAIASLDWCHTQTSGHKTKWHSCTWTASVPCKSALHLLLLRKWLPQELKHPPKFMDSLQGAAADLGKRFKGSFNQLCFQDLKTNGACSMR